VHPVRRVVQTCQDRDGMLPSSLSPASLAKHHRRLPTGSTATDVDGSEAERTEVECRTATHDTVTMAARRWMVESVDLSETKNSVRL